MLFIPWFSLPLSLCRSLSLYAFLQHLLHFIMQGFFSLTFPLAVHLYQFVCHLKYVCDVCISLRSTCTFRMWSNAFSSSNKKWQQIHKIILYCYCYFVCCFHLCMGFVVVVAAVFVVLHIYSFVQVSFFFWHQHQKDRWCASMSVCGRFFVLFCFTGLFELWDGLRILVTYALHVNIIGAIQGESQMKLGIIKNWNWSRDWSLTFIWSAWRITVAM